MKSIMFSGGNNPPQKITGTFLAMDIINKPLNNTNKGLNLSVNSLPQLNPLANQIIPSETKIPFLGNNSTSNTLSFSSNPSITYQPSPQQSIFSSNKNVPEEKIPGILNTLKTKGWEAFDAGCKSDTKDLEGSMYIISGMVFGAMSMVGLGTAAVLTGGLAGGHITFTEVCIFGGIDGIANLIMSNHKEQIRASLPWQVKYLIEVKQRIVETPEYKEISTILESFKNPPLNGGMMYKQVIYSLPCPHLVKRVEELGAKLIVNLSVAVVEI